MCALLMLVLVVACGGVQDTIEGDLAAATEIAVIPSDVMEPVGRDRYGFSNPTSQATLDVFEVEPELAVREGVFREAADTNLLRFVRNPVSLGVVGNILDSADSILVILIPLLDPTRDLQVDFDSYFVSLDPNGSVVSSDYAGETTDVLAALVEFGRSQGLAPVEIVAAAARGLNAETPVGVDAEAAAFILDR